ncbi:uncharacterized protein B0I36DRAFT_319724 [Microdochium trichocladiopsis]|uniref:Uncharacterized protein n=1 Tax=Microdochium trichocladiopsis TaxID=1682393 RepID=A0A9P9BRD4_9PEZI|nr:uncharacterized protein B0I36DRAFT_319724 [Microdochium trichocladiopsis]KAH7032608.1 hypothetical protein B0I36DRAFT_319724 [Microdochium trichocladiopsis]
MPFPSPSTPVREHYTRHWEGPLRDARHEFGNAICHQERYLCGKQIPESLKSMGRGREARGGSDGDKQGSRVC